MHLFVDISAHGFGHLALTAPVLNALAAQVPGLRLTVRSKLPEYKLRQRIRVPFAHIAAASDFGFEMQDATRVDLQASARLYQEIHQGWPQQVAREQEFLGWLAPDLILTSASYLPLQAAKALGVPGVALSCLNWADLFAHYFGQLDWGQKIHAEIRAAYGCAQTFICPAPSMPMPSLDNCKPVGPIAQLGRRRDLDLPEGEKAVLIAYGGIAMELPMDQWPDVPGVRWLVPQAWPEHPRAIAFEPLGLAFTDLLCSVDAVLTKPGYGTFAEAACNGTPVLYQRRDDWPEQESLIPWLKTHARAREIDAEALMQGDLSAPLEQLWQQALPPVPRPAGVAEAASLLAGILGPG